MGVLVTKGSRVSIPAGGLAIEISHDGSLRAEAKLQVSYDMYPQWLRIMADQAKASEQAAREVSEIWRDGSTNAEIERLEAELRSGMQACVAAAAAIDGFYGTVTHLAAPSPNWSTAKSPRYARIAEAMKQSFEIRSQSFDLLRNHLKTLFTFRDEAVHPIGITRDPVHHPRFGVATERRLVMYSAENARNIGSLTMSIICQCLSLAKASYPKLVEHCDLVKEIVYPLVEDWETHTGNSVPR